MLVAGSGGSDGFVRILAMKVDPVTTGLTSSPSYEMPSRGSCGYCAMLVMKSQVDHFIPVALLKVQGKDTLAYEWSNYRYAVVSTKNRTTTERVYRIEK